MAGVFCASAVLAQIPAADQVETFTRIFSFDKELSGKTVTVLLVAPDGAPRALEAIRGAFEGAGVRARTAIASRAGDEISGVSVVYFDPGAVTSEAQVAVIRAGALSIAADPQLATAGQVSVALDPRPDRIGIVVSVPRLSAEGHTLSPQLLRQPWVTLAKEVTASGSGTTPPCKVTQFSSPDYPIAARRMGVEGTVHMLVLVGSDLKGERVDVVNSVQFLDETAVRAAMRSEYGTPGWCALAIPFKLQ
jgi:hypothetical protein